MTEYIKWVKPEADKVDQEETGLSAWYKAIWSRIGGRPFTYVIRDLWHSYPLLWILGGGGILLGAGVILGHLFWGGG